MDYRDLLMKYIAHVGDCEGVTFIHRINERNDGVKFSDAEAEELRLLDKESEKYMQP